VQRLRKNYMVGGAYDLQSDDMAYDAGAEEALSEPLDCYLELVPGRWRIFGLH
jgi:hypothetical protein